MQQYLNMPFPSATLGFLKLFYGGRTKTNIPFLLKLGGEIKEATQSILHTQASSTCNELLTERKNLMFRKLSKVLAREESATLYQIIEELMNHFDTKLMCLLYDGAILESNNTKMTHDFDILWQDVPVVVR